MDTRQRFVLDQSDSPSLEDMIKTFTPVAQLLPIPIDILAALLDYEPTAVTSLTLWTLKNKFMAAKFPSSQSGYTDMHAAMLALSELEHMPGVLSPGQEHLFTAGHLIHEVRSEVAARLGIEQHPGALTFDQLMEGIAKGDYCRITSIIPPCFGFPLAERGGMTSAVEEVWQGTVDLLVEALVRNFTLKANDMGLGITVLWPAYQTFLALHMGPNFRISNEWIMASPQWQRFKNGIVTALRRAKEITEEQLTIHFEWKTNDPGAMDVIPTLYLAMQMAFQINEALGWTAILINNELAHIGLAGGEFGKAVRRTIAAGLHRGLIHLNVGPISPIRLEHLLAQGNFHPANWFGGVDPDWPFGYGDWFLLDQQWQVIVALLIHSTMTGDVQILEHDVVHAPMYREVGDLYGLGGCVNGPETVLAQSAIAANTMWHAAKEALDSLVIQI